MVVLALFLTHKHSFGFSCSLFSPTSVSCGEGKHIARARRSSKEENSIYSFKPIIEDSKLRGTEYKNNIGVSESEILIDATIPFKALGI